MATENEQIDLCVLNQSHLIEIFEDSFNGSEPNDTTVQDFLINVNNHCEHVLLHKWISIIVPIIFAVIVLVATSSFVMVVDIGNNFGNMLGFTCTKHPLVVSVPIRRK